MQELRKSVTGNVPSKSVTLYHIDLAWVTRVQVTQVLSRYCFILIPLQVSQCQAALTNLLTRIWAETEDNARLLEKREQIEANLASMRASGASEVR